MTPRMSPQPTPTTMTPNEPKDLSHIYRRMTADRLEEIGGFELPADIPNYWKQAIHDLWQEAAARFELDENAEEETKKLSHLSPGSVVRLLSGEEYKVVRVAEKAVALFSEGGVDWAPWPLLKAAITAGATVLLAGEEDANGR